MGDADVAREHAPAEGAAAPGTFDVERSDDVTMVALLGEHDIATSAELARVIAHADGNVVVSVAQTEFVDSSIVRALFESDKQLRSRDRRLVLLVGEGSIVERVLDLAGVSARIGLARTREQALELARDGGPEEAPSP